MTRNDAPETPEGRGADDPPVPVEARRGTVRHIEGAKLKVIGGMGHDLAPGLVPILVEAIAAHCQGREEGSLPPPS